MSIVKPMTKDKLRHKYGVLVTKFLDEYESSPIKAFGTNPFTGAYNSNKKQVLDNFKQNNAMFKAIAKTSGIELELLDTSNMNPPDGDEIDLG